MMEAVREVVAFDGLPLLIGAVVIAGIVRGFTGFGTALVYVPIASTVLPPVWVLATMIIYDTFGALPMLPRALRDGDLRDVLRLLPGAFLGLIVGLAILTRVDPLVFRWATCTLALALLVVLASGWRYRRALGLAGKSAIGLAAGFLGAVAGVPGPPVILFYMGGPAGAAMIRANIMMFLITFDVLFIGLMVVNGHMTAFPVVIGLMLIAPYALAGLLGQAIFKPERETTYRRVSYAVIALAAISGMPLFD